MDNNFTRSPAEQDGVPISKFQILYSKFQSMYMTKKQQHTGLKLGFGLAAVAAAAAGAYFFYGKDGAKNRKQLKGWMVKAKGEVMDNLEKLNDVSQPIYEKVVSEVMKKYKKLKQATPGEWASLNKELKSQWKSIKKEVDKAAKKFKK